MDFYGTLATQLGDGLIMEYCPGGSVGDLVNSRGVFSLGECITALAPVAQTLSIMHAEGTRHGDISPANVLLTASGMPKIIDFQETASQSEWVSGAGTPGFMAPEVSPGGREHATGEQDVYSLGACLWFLLSGKPPEQEILRPPVQVQFPALPEIIQELLVESLDSDPRLRPSAEQFARTLFSSASAEPIRWEGHVSPEATHLMETIHPGTREPSSRRGRKNPKPAGQPSPADEPVDTWPIHPLRPTPGAMKLVGAAVLGLVVVAGSLVGVNHLRAATASDATNEPTVAIEPSCRIDDMARGPACALQQDTVVSAFLSLTKQRDWAMSKLSSGDLKAIYSSGAEQLQRDQETIATLRELGLRFEGLQTQLTNVSIEARGQGNTVVLSADSSQSQYHYVDRKGRQIHTVKATTAERIEIELVLSKRGWRIGNVLRH
ncbi:protein kinase [Glutamicibacter sp. JL.03c]|uniref:serine/threonine protein kinase n=1 Tax=Glutamicibacter sp. JL.03c TaxID=2984842 RepID=UPI0021F6A9C3|nr:protein kinase [Glutamicibacter sp. JL.03c]UYQ76346.1 protein kinase [Glutamicibacter sp. JL.03c]